MKQVFAVLLLVLVLAILFYLWRVGVIDLPGAEGALVLPVVVGAAARRERDGWKLPPTWSTMTDDEQKEWSLQMHLGDRFPGFTFKVTMHPFCVFIKEDDADVSAVQAEVDLWFDCVYGTKVKWGEPIKDTFVYFLHPR